LTESGSLTFAFCRGSWCERSCSRSATTIHSVAVDRTPSFSIAIGADTELSLWRKFCV